MATALENARRLAELGFNVLPARVGGKAPTLSWQKYQNIRTDDRLGQWFSGGERNYWILCGRISRTVVLDCDSAEAIAYWRKVLEPDDGDPHPMDATASVVTRKGRHYYFRIETDDIVPSWSRADGEVRFDVRAEGTGVIAPPSVHETGHVYAWAEGQGPDRILPLPPEVRHQQAAGGGSGDGGSAPRSMLAALLSSGAKEGDRNNWFARVCGHYAKEYRDRQDAYQLHCWMAFDRMENPHGRDEAAKTIDSVWAKEQRKLDGLSPNEDNGHLVPGDHNLLTPCKVKVREGESERTEEVLRQWANFDLRAIGVVEGEGDDRVYDVILRRKRQRDEVSDLLPAKTLSDPKAMNAWLANHGSVITTPSDQQVSRVREGARLQLYIEDQNPPHFEAVSCLGWHDGDFVCHEGVIDAEGLHAHRGRKPAVHLRSRAKHRYGFVDEETARETLREVLTFHDETVAAVFGSWWAATLLKPQIKARFSQFPIMAIEAPSESGKTTGMFPMLLQLSGSTEGQALSTKAAMTRNLADHNTGVVWIDDANDLTHVDELLRAVTGDGFIKKMGEDRTNTVVEELVAPVMLSGEALGRSDQKATADRRVTLDVPSPVGRMSRHDPAKAQWDDIQKMRAAFPDGLSVMAGNIVQMAARYSGEIERAASASQGGTRNQHKLTVLMIGARILARMTGDETWIERVSAWVKDAAEAPGSHNTMIERMIPEALARMGVPSWPLPGGLGTPSTPAFVEDDVVYYHPGALAMWWESLKHGRVEERTETARALELQRKAMGGKPRIVRFSRRDPNSKKANYWALPPDVSAHVMRCVEGIGDGQETLPADQPDRQRTPSSAPAATRGANTRLAQLPAQLVRFMEEKVDLSRPEPPKTV